MGNGKDPLGILTTTPAPQKKVADPLGILKKKDWVSRTFGTGSQNGGLSGGSGLGKIGMAVEKAPKTPQEKVNSLGINVTFEKEQPKNLLENPGIYYKQPDFLQASKPTYIDVDNPEHLSYLSSKVKEAKDKADPTKYGLFISDEQKEKYRPGEAKEKIAYADELMQEISGAAAKNAFNKIISEKHPSMIGRNDLTQVGIEYLKQVDPAQYKRNKTIIDAGEDLGDENKYNLEKIGGSILKNNLPFITDDAATLNNIEELIQLTDQAHPEIALAKGWDIIGAYNHKKDNKATGGWWRTKPTLGQAKKWIDEPELVEMFKGNEVAYDEIKRKLSEMPDELNNFKLDEVPVGGLMNNFGRAILGSAENVGNIFRGDVKRQQANLNPTLGRGTLTGNYHDPGESPALLQQLYSLEANEKDGTITESEKQQLKALRNSTKVRDGWDKISDGTGNISGQVVSQVLLSKGAGLGTNSVRKLASLSNATKNTINASIATALNSYDQSRQQAVYNFPDDKVKQGIYTGTMVAANVASERIFKDEKVLDAFKKELKGDLVNYVKNLSTQNINRAAIKNLLTEKLLKFGGETIKESNKEAIEESVVQVVDEAMQAGLGAEGYDGDKALERIGNTYATTMLYGGAVGALAAKSNLAADKFNRVQIYRMANNPEIFQKEIQRQFEAGDITNAERQEKFDILNKAAEIAAAEPPKVAALPTKKKAEYLTHQLNIAINEGLLEGAKDPNLQEELKGNIEESQKRAKAIYESEPEVLEEISEPELTPEQTKAAKILGLANLPDTLMVGAEADPVGTLKDIAHQAQGVGVNPETGQIEPLDGGGRTEDLLAMGYPQKVIDQAIEMFPAQPKLADQVRELADENTPDEAGVSGSALKDKKADIERRRPTSYIENSKDKKSSLETFRNEAKREWNGVSIITGDRMQNLYVGIQLFVKAYPKYKELLDKFIKNDKGYIGITNNNLSFVLNTLKKEGINTESELGGKINAKYDAELSALEESEGVSGSALKDDPDLKNIDPTIIAARSGDKQAQKKLEEYGLDWEQTTTYRFVGQSEVDVLLSNNKVESKRGMADAGIDVTTSPKVTSAASNEYRVTFKESFDVNNGLGKVKSKSKEEGDHHLEKGRGYDINDVAKIEKIDEKGNVVETIYESAPPQYTEAAGVSGSALKDVETKQQIENFGVPKEDVEATHGLLNQVFSGLKKAGLTAAKTVGDWVGIGKGSEKPYSLKIGDKEVQVKNTQPEVVNGFYSPLEKVITESKFDKLPAKQWAEKYANSEEAKWTGLKDWLAQQQGSVSKADIQQFLKDNRIQVVEVVKDMSEDKMISADEENKLTDALIDDYDYFGLASVFEAKEAIAKNEDWAEKYNVKDKKLIKLGNKYRESVNAKQGGKPKFETYQIEGQKENYKEVLVTLPSRSKRFGLPENLQNSYDTVKYAERTYGKNSEEYQNARRAFGRLALDEGMSNQDVLDFLKDGQFEKTDFRSTHFDEPNILVHLRMNTRTDAEGKKVLFLEEVQSDWGQKGKKEGFINKERENLKKRYDDLKIKNKELLSKLKTALETKNDAEYNKLIKEQQKVEDEISSIQDYTEEKGYDLKEAVPSAPFVTDTNAWVKLGLKVALKEAVKQGADKIAWTTGEQQNERYDLSKQVKKIMWNKIDGGKTYKLFAIDNNGDTRVLGEHKPSELEGVVGKEVAQKIINEEGLKETYEEQNSKYGELEGLDLKVGGKGMKGFYGSPKENSLGIVGNVAKSLFKQEPKTVEIETAKNNEYTLGEANYVDGIGVYDGKGDMVAEFDTKAEANKFIAEKSNQTQHSIDITPEMKAEVEGKGQPLFKDAEAQYRIESGKNIIEAIKDFNQSKNKARATVALTHEIMHPTVVSIIDGAKEGNEVGTKHTETIVNEFNKANPNSKVTVEDLIQGNDAFKDGTTSKQYRQVQEFIAKAWEKYHTEGGKGFSESFQKVLDQITKAFQSVYKSITGKQLTPELKQMFDDILGKEAPPQYTEAATPKEQIQENNLNLQDNGKESQNIEFQKSESTSSSTQPSREESPEKLQKRYERVIGETDLTDPYDRVLEFFANGGKINASSIENVFGGKDKRINWKASTEGEKRSKIGLIAKDGQSIDKLADTLSRRDPKEENDSQVYKNAIEQVLLTHNSKSQMQQALVDKYDLENAYEKYMEQAYGKEAIDIVEKMSEEEINYLLQLDSEKAGEFIDDLVEKKIADEKPTIQEADTAAKQKIAELEAERDAKILKEGKPDVKLEFVSAKELVDSKDPIGNRNIHNDIKERFKKLKEILDCIHG